MAQSLSKATEKSGLDRAGKKRVFEVLFYLSLEAVILFVAAGTLDWPAAWLYVGVRLFTLLSVGIWVARRNPELINERGRSSDKTKGWDKVFAAIYAPLLFITPAVAGLDFRFGWSAVPVAWQIVGLLALVPAMILPYWAMDVNRFLVKTVRIQEERGHQVVTTGPYRYVRHPMYVGAILLSLSGPLLLGSWRALLLGALSAAAIVGRTILEDKTLQRELPGYSEYAERVRYRLVPGIW